MAAQVFDRTNAVTPIVSVEERLRRAKAAYTPVEQLPPAKTAVQEIAPAPIVDEWAELDQDHFIEPKAEVPPPAPTKSLLRTIAEASIARGETRILPILIGAKSPAIRWKDTAIDVLSTKDWAQALPSWIDELEAKYPDLNGCAIAKPDEQLFIDNDTAAEFRAGYEAWSGEAYPVTFTTSATENHYQEHFLQTDATRAMGNIPQFAVDGISISVRQRNLYVLIEGSKHPSGRTYMAVVQAHIVPMPDKMVAYIQYLRQKAAEETIKTQQAESSEPSSETSEPERKLDISLAKIYGVGVDGPMIPAHTPGHDNVLFSIGCSLRTSGETSGSGGWDYLEIEERLIQIADQRCEGRGQGDYVRMAKKCAKSACTHDKGIPSRETVIMSQTEATKKEQATNAHVESIPTQPVVTEKTLDADLAKKVETAKAAKLDEKKRIQALLDKVRKEKPQLQFHYAGLITLGPRPHMIFGSKGSYKSTFALELAMCNACGADWLYQKNLLGPRRVLYIDMENSSGAGETRFIEALAKFSVREQELIRKNLRREQLNEISYQVNILIDNEDLYQVLQDEWNPDDIFYDCFYAGHTAKPENQKTVLRSLWSYFPNATGRYLVHHTGRKDKDIMKNPKLSLGLKRLGVRDYAQTIAGSIDILRDAGTLIAIDLRKEKDANNEEVEFLDLQIGGNDIGETPCLEFEKVIGEVDGKDMQYTWRLHPSSNLGSAAILIQDKMNGLGPFKSWNALLAAYGSKNHVRLQGLKQLLFTGLLKEFEDGWRVLESSAPEVAQEVARVPKERDKALNWLSSRLVIPMPEADVRKMADQESILLADGHDPYPGSKLHAYDSANGWTWTWKQSEEEARVQQIKELYEKNPKMSQREMAKVTGIPQSSVGRIRLKLGIIVTTSQSTPIPVAVRGSVGQ